MILKYFVCFCLQIFNHQRQNAFFFIFVQAFYAISLFTHFLITLLFNFLYYYIFLILQCARIWFYLDQRMIEVFWFSYAITNFSWVFPYIIALAVEKPVSYIKCWIYFASRNVKTTKYLTTNLCFCCSMLILSLFLHSYHSFSSLTGYFMPMLFVLLQIHICTINSCIRYVFE